MKEHTYGWYPSAKDVYRPKGRPSTHHLDGLHFRDGPQYSKEMYFQGHMGPPEGELFVRGPATYRVDTAADRRKRAKSLNVPKFKPVPKLHIPTLAQCWTSHKMVPQETTWGVTSDFVKTPARSENSWPLPHKDKAEHQTEQQEDQTGDNQQQQQQQQQQTIMQQHLQVKFGKTTPTPQYAWGMRPSSTAPSPRSVQSTDDVTWPTAVQITPQVRPHTAVSVQLSERPSKSSSKPRPASSRPAPSPSKTTPRAQSARPLGVPPTSGGPAHTPKPVRIQSATVRREKTPLPSRPVTAGVSRLQKPTPPTAPSPRKVSPTPRQPTHVPFVYDVNDVTVDDDDVASQASADIRGDVIVRHDGRGDLGGDYVKVDHRDQYTRMVDQYGWRAEVHGDPYGLKRPAQRLSYVVQCQEPTVAPEPPTVHMETNEPFFHNTIPKRPATFAVHKEWMSEVLLAKRVELQNRCGGVKYNYKNFAFAY